MTDKQKEEFKVIVNQLGPEHLELLKKHLLEQEKEYLNRIQTQSQNPNHLEQYLKKLTDLMQDQNRILRIISGKL